jgi:hypothetical protein
MPLVAAKPQDKPRDDRERLSRVMLACTGVALAILPPIMVAEFGWPAVSLTPVIPLGVLLVVLSAFYRRISGEVRCGVFSVTINPSGGRSPDNMVDLSQPGRLAVPHETARGGAHAAS